MEKKIYCIWSQKRKVVKNELRKTLHETFGGSLSQYTA